MNLLRKIILPKNTCTSFLFLGREIPFITSTHFGSIFTPYLVTICPNSFPSSRENMDFLGVKRQTIPSTFVKSSSKMLYMLSVALREDSDVVQVNYHKLILVSYESDVHRTLECGTGVYQEERHSSVHEGSLGRSERRLLLDFREHRHLIIS